METTQDSKVTRYITGSNNDYTHPLFRKQQESEKLEINKQPLKPQDIPTYEQAELPKPESAKR